MLKVGERVSGCTNYNSRVILPVFPGETLDSLTSQLSVAEKGWKSKSTGLHQNHKDRLLEFGLNASDI